MYVCVSVCVCAVKATQGDVSMELGVCGVVVEWLGRRTCDSTVASSTPGRSAVT